MNYFNILEQLLAYEKRAIAFQWRAFAALTVIAIVFIMMNVGLGWYKNAGADMGNIFIALLTYIPLSQVTKRKDHIEALAILKARIGDVGQEPEKELIEMIRKRMEEMLKS